MTLLRLSATLLLGACAAGCVIAEKSIEPGAIDAGVDAEPDAEPPVPYTNLDLLFVIDNSGSMAQEQGALALAIPPFLNELASNGQLPGLHVGVVTSALGIGPHPVSNCDEAPIDGGDLITPAGCNVGGTYLSDVGGVRNYTGGLGDATACMAQVGVEGCGFEQHLEAMRVVLAGERPSSAGFLRDDALLVVVILADEDDCSASDTTLFDPTTESLGELGLRCTAHGVLCAGAPPATIGLYADCQPNQLSGYVHPATRYRDFLRDLKPDPRSVVLVTITGVPSPFEVIDADPTKRVIPKLGPSCASTTGEAAPAVRINWLGDHVERAFTANICDDIATTMASLATFVRTALDGN